MSAGSPAGLPSALAFLTGGGEMGRRMRAHDWTNSALGSPEYWPQSLKTIVRVMLDSRYAMWMAWGPELTFFCNDAYLPTVGLKRDWVLGARSEQVWKEIWPDIGPRIEHVLASGQATWDEGLLLFLERSGFLEETYHTFSYSPVYNDEIRIAGILCVVTEVTERVIGERRLRMLRDLAAQSVGLESVDDTCRRAVQVLSQYPSDLPFTALYLLSPGEPGAGGTLSDGQQARRVALSRELPREWFPAFLANHSGNPWMLGRLGSEHLRQVVADLPELGLGVPADPWPEPVQDAVVLPLMSAAQERLVGFLIVGVSPRRAFDDAYGSFLDLVASQVASAIANAKAYEVERERAEALAEIDRAKTTFFSNVSHEFRTPLTLMLGPIEDMTTDPQILPAVRSRLEVVHRNSLRLLKLVNSLLEFSRIEAGRVQAAYAPLDLTLLTRDVVSTFGSALEQAGLALVQQLEPLPEPVYVDRDMWERIVLNLMSNAFKYTLRGEIEVRLSQEGGFATFAVRDTGIGIPSEAIPNLFNRFYRVEGAEGRTHEGTGIGLALVHELVKLHSGTLSVDSEVGRGSTFTIRIPLGRAHLPQDHISEARPHLSPVASARPYIQEALRWLPDAQPGRGITEPAAFSVKSASSSRDSSNSADPRARILVADDNSDMRAYVRELLEPRYDVEVVRDGQAALDAARRSPPDLIISDVMMPRMDGFELLRALRSEPGLLDVPAILLSARAGEEAMIEGLEAMADDYLVKPFAARELLARVGAQLQLAHLRREAEEREQALRAEAESLLNEAPLGIYVVDSNFRIRNVNPTARLVFGAFPDPVGRDFGEVIHAMRPKVYADEVVRLFRRTLETGEVYVTTEQMEELSGRGPAEHYEWQISRIPLPDGQFAVACYFRNVSAHVQARIALEVADRQKNEFLAMLAHELRNPLAPIRNAGEILARSLPPDSPTHAAIAMVKRQVTQLTRLVDDLLDVSRITQGRVELKRELLELAGVINHAVETVEPMFRERHHAVCIVSSYQALHVHGDRARLVQCVVNILTNAAKYTDPAGRISLQTRAEGAYALIEISDTGAGISPELLPRVFDLFVQGDRTLDRSSGGLGIGLSVAKRLVEMHGGKVAAESSGLGLGSTFKLWLPLIARHGDVPGDTAHPKPEPKRILIVDDNADAADSLAALLELDGHITQSVYSARDALERAVVFKPDVMLLDIGLPEIDGYEVARRLREQPGLKDIRLIALTGYGQIEDLRRAQAAGFDDHLVKPVDFATLQRCLAGSHASAFNRRIS